MDYTEILKKLNGRGFQAELCADAAAAKARALEIIGAASAGFGGSKTVCDLNLYEALEAQGNKVYWHWKVGLPEKKAARDNAIRADVYVSSCNALLTDGRIVNIDGTGNRIMGLSYGPSRVLMIVGRNKLVEGGFDAAIERIKRETCPENARRLKLDTPCAKTDRCYDCRVPGRMCNVTTVHEAPTRIHKEFRILLVDEDLGL